MAKRKQYDDEFRASAVVMLESQGYPNTPGALSAVAAHLSVPPRTLSRWFRRENNPPPAKLVMQKKGELVARLDTLIDKFVERMYDEADDAPLRELSTAFGIAVDKKQLLTGGATARNEDTVKHDVSDGLREAVLSRLSRIADSAPTGDGD